MDMKMREIFEYTTPKRIERRRGRDRIGKISLFLLLFSWFAWIIGFVFLHIAIPERETVLDIIASHEVRHSWVTTYLYAGMAVWFSGVFTGLMSFFVVRKRTRRKSDHTGITTFLSVLLNTISVILLIITIILNGL